MLSSGGILTLLGDQSAGKKACWVSFFGRPASTHKAVALFSLANDAPTMVSYARRLDRPLRYEVGPEVDRRPPRSGFPVGQYSAAGAVVHRPSGTIDPSSSGAILVAAPALEGPPAGPAEARPIGESAGRVGPGLGK